MKQIKIKNKKKKLKKKYIYIYKFIYIDKINLSVFKQHNIFYLFYRKKGY